MKKGEYAIYEVLHRIGQEAVNWARVNGTYTDRTGNLRNSIGYAIFKNGKLIDYIRESTGGTHPSAEQQSLDFINLLQSSGNLPSSGYALVVFAGMEYGVYVEAKGFIVLSGAIEHSETLKVIHQALKQAIKR